MKRNRTGVWSVGEHAIAGTNRRGVGESAGAVGGVVPRERCCAFGVGAASASRCKESGVPVRVPQAGRGLGSGAHLREKGGGARRPSECDLIC